MFFQFQPGRNVHDPKAYDNRNSIRNSINNNKRRKKEIPAHIMKTELKIDLQLSD
jgi:hypothetical protein